MRIIALLALSALASIVPIAAAADTTGSLVGQVRDVTGLPIAAATVRVGSGAEVAQTTSDANGRYCFVNLVPGLYALSIAKLGYGKVVSIVSVEAGNQTVANWVLPMRIVGSLMHYDANGIVDRGQTADVYKIRRSNPLFETSRTIGELLPFVPGVLVTGGSPYPR